MNSLTIHIKLAYINCWWEFDSNMSIIFHPIKAAQEVLELII